MSAAVSSGVAAWNRFVETAGQDVTAIDAGIATLAAAAPGAAADLGRRAFRVGLASLLVGADEVGRLALAMEAFLDAVASESSRQRSSSSGTPTNQGRASRDCRCPSWRRRSVKRSLRPRRRAARHPRRLSGALRREARLRLWGTAGEATETR